MEKLSRADAINIVEKTLIDAEDERSKYFKNESEHGIRFDDSKKEIEEFFSWLYETKHEYMSNIFRDKQFQTSLINSFYEAYQA